MKKIAILAASLFLSITMQAQDRSMPKAGPAPTININQPETFSLSNGLKVLVVENHKLPRISFTLTTDNPPYAEGAKKGVADLVSSMIGNGTTNMSKDDFNEETDFLGANFNFWADGAAASGLSKDADRILELLADGALNPLFTQDEFDKEKAKMIEGLKSDEKNVTSIARRVEGVLTYGKEHYKGEYVSEETLNNVTLGDVIENYNTYYVPGNAYLVVVGDVTVKDVKKMVKKQFKNWSKATAPDSSSADPVDVQYSQINFIDATNAVQSEVALVNFSKLKMTDKDYFAALLANQILGGGGEGRLFLNLREANAWTYGAYSSLGSGKTISRFRAGAAVRNTVTDSSVVELFNEIRRIRTEKVSDEDLKNAKAKYVGNFVMQIEKPATVARYALNKETESLPEDFYENYIKNINAVTAEELMAAANKYFLIDNMRVIITGKAGDVLPGLEKLSKDAKLPIFYFDKFGNPTEKPVVNIPIPSGVTTQTVLDGYLKAIGGKDAASKIKSVYIMSEAFMQGQKLQREEKRMNTKLYKTFGMGGMVVMKQVVNGDSSYAVMQGQKKELEGEELEAAIASATVFPELTKMADAELVAIEMFNDTQCYVLKQGNTSFYYDTKQGLKLGEVTTSEQGSQTISFEDYKDVKGLKFPYKSIIGMGAMNLEFITTEVKINEGVTADDFN